MTDTNYSNLFNMKKYSLKKKIFLDGDINIARYDEMKYPVLEKFTERMLSFFWRPEEVNISKDKSDFRKLSDAEQHIFTSNLKRQILLDSIQGRAPVQAFLPISSIPEMEPLLLWWTAFETLHSKTYTHIIRNIYPDPSSVFDEIINNKNIVGCADSLTHYYDELLYANKNELYKVNKEGEYEHKKNIYMALMSINVLEGIRFYVSFACSWAFAELNSMEGNAKLIKLIARDENVHLAITTQLIKLLPNDDKIFKKIANDDAIKEECIAMFQTAVNSEKEWAKYLFKDGSMIGLSEAVLSQYVEWIANKRIRAVGLNSPFDAGGRANPLPWTENWISGATKIQVANQETENSDYAIGDIKNDVENLSDILKGFKL